MVDIAIKVRQETGSFCGPAVVEMLLNNLDKRATQAEIVEACGARDTVMREGIPLVGLAKGIKKLFPDLQVWEKQNSSVEDIKKLLSNGYLVAIDWQGIFTEDEYGDEIWNTKDKIAATWSKIKKDPISVGDQGHYCIVVDIDIENGFIKFVDPYGHYAGKYRFVAIWELEERWWDDRLELDDSGKKKLIYENRMMFVVAPENDSFLGSIGLVKI